MIADEVERNGDWSPSDRDREREREKRAKKDDKDREREKDKDRAKDKDKDRKGKDSSSSSSSRKGDDKDREKDKGRDRKRSSRERERDRSRDRSPRERERSRDRSSRERRDRDRQPRQRSSRSRSPRSSRRSRRDSRDRSPKEKRKRTPSPPKPSAEEEAKKKAEEEERERHRDEYTVFVSQLHPKVNEKDLFDFFSMVGRVEDIRLIRDQRTNKSKGLCYVEFWEKVSVLKAVALTGHLLGGYPIAVQIVQTPKDDGGKQAPNMMRLYVSSLHFNVTEKDLRPVFEAFGPVDFVDLHKDENGVSRGFGFVQFNNEADARQAMQALNGIEIAGRPMKVGLVDQKMDTSSGAVGKLDELDDGEGGGLALTAQSRAQLMQKLQRGQQIVQPPAPIQAMLGNLTASTSAAQQIPAVPRFQPSTCIVVKNMFDPAKEEGDFDLDIKEDVEEECAKHGPIKHLFVDKQNQGGNVYVRFHDKAVAEKVVKAFHGRWYASRQISSDFVPEITYNARFPDSNK